MNKAERGKFKNAGSHWELNTGATDFSHQWSNHGATTTRQPPALHNPLHVHVYAAQVVRMLQSCIRQQVFEDKRLFKLHVLCRPLWYSQIGSHNLLRV